MFIIRAGFSLDLLTNRGIALCSSVFLLSWIFISTAAAQKPQVIDGSHFSNMLGEVRKYRVYLLSDYHDSPERQYPVIYFYHGWSQRYFGSKEAKSESDSQLSDEEKIAVLGSKYGVIVVKPDGYNRRPNEPYYLRPYNIGPVETHRQFPHYFPELVEYIDANYRTIAERAQRGITGFSMGGFMSFWVAGKYPHLVSAAGSFCGSAEFVIGPVDFPVEYFHGEMYGNYEGLKLRLHHGENDFIRAYHRDIDRIWKQVMDNYESRQYPGRHELVGMEDMFQFFEESFDNPADVPNRWNHIDVYPEFSVWDYEVSSDRNFPGFTVLENVDKQGFKISVRSQHTKGETLPRTKLSITTAPLYGINNDYQVTIFDLDNNKKTQTTLRSNLKGRLKIDLNGGRQEVGIHKISGKPNIAISTVVITSGNYSASKTHTPIEITLINKGGSKAEGITAELIGRGSAELEDKIVQVGDIGVLSTATVSPLVFHIPSESIGTQKFTLKLKDRNNNEWQEDFVLHLKPKGKPIERFEIADGREVTFLKGGKDTVSMVLGVGNGDGIPNPGESIVVLVNDGGINRLTSLHSFSPLVDLKSSHTRVSDSWSNFDHVG
ncbi:alpha/beta hydrolase-fold protein [Lunatibacter salilacus]|uniref:alpha/beta hydrolase-fold protein n=1 Tax=Lunatibacter salilacus TaxID=2483804 RepID=UPI00131D5B1E|nr:alpha/beta hydrolase-fold protein [Lunatibacter salilacus]